jgi:hypothetical protein
VDAKLSAIMRDGQGRNGIVTTSLSAELSSRALIAGANGRTEIGHQFNAPSDLDVLVLGEGNPAMAASRMIHTRGIAGHGIRIQAEKATRCARAGLLDCRRVR